MEKVITVKILSYELAEHVLMVIKRISILDSCIEHEKQFIEDDVDDSDRELYFSLCQDRQFYGEQLDELLPILKETHDSDYNILERYKFDWNRIPENKKHWILM